MAASAAKPSAAFWDRVADRYSKQPIADEAAYHKKLRVTREYFRPDMSVLEIGCGTGSTAILHAPYVRHIRGVDISEKMIEIARAKLVDKKIDNVTFEQSRIGELEVPAGSVDAVLALSVLHLVPDKDATIADVFEMLAPGGVFVTSTACLGGVLKYVPMRVIIPIGRLFGRLPMVKFFKPEQLEESLTAAGFAIDYRWQAGKGKALFIVAKKPE